MNTTARTSSSPSTTWTSRCRSCCRAATTAFYGTTTRSRASAIRGHGIGVADPDAIRRGWQAGRTHRELLRNGQSKVKRTETDINYQFISCRTRRKFHLRLALHRAGAGRDLGRPDRCRHHRRRIRFSSTRQHTTSCIDGQLLRRWLASELECLVSTTSSVECRPANRSRSAWSGPPNAGTSRCSITTRCRRGGTTCRCTSEVGRGDRLLLYCRQQRSMK